MSGFYYSIRLVDLDLNQSQLNKIRDYVREKVRDVAAIDSGEFLRSIATRWDSGSNILTVYSPLYYAGYIESGNINYMHHKGKVRKVLTDMGLKVSPIRYY